jgi:hypothetical protein
VRPPYVRLPGDTGRIIHEDDQQVVVDPHDGLVHGTSGG